MIKLVIFDWDDVFTLGSKEGYIACLHQTLVALDVHLDPQEEHKRILETWSQPHELELANLLREHPHRLQEACRVYEEQFFGDTFVSALRYVDGANQLLMSLRNEYTLAIATGAHPEVLRGRVMPRFNVPADTFSTILTAYEIDDPEKAKPHPYMLEEIMRINKCLPSETVFVGDARSDVQAAHNAGVTPIVVLTGHLTREQAVDLDVTKLPLVLDTL